MFLINMLLLLYISVIVLKVSATANGEIYNVCWRKREKCKNKNIYANIIYSL